MGSDINLNKVLENRKKILDDLIQRINSWDKTAELGIDIVEKNQSDIERLQSIEKILQNNNLSYLDKEYIQNISYILQGEKDIINNLSKRHAEVKNIIKQLGNKDKIKDNYIKQNQNSIFIDRHF